MNAQPKYRRPLNQSQLQLLITLYKFRFATAQLIADSQGAKYTRVILARLKILVDQAYIGQKYESSYKIIGKPASYYLLPKGIGVLRKQAFANPNVLKRIYYDKNQDDTHITHRLNVFKTYLFVKQNYPKQFQFFSKSELSGRKYIPRDLTDAYLKRNANTASETNGTNPNTPKLPAKHYFLSYYEATAKIWRLNNSIRRYVAYAESEKWQPAAKQSFPTVLLVCEDESLKRKVQRIADHALQDSWTDLKFVVLTLNP
jgi:hypothetical protein